MNTNTRNTILEIIKRNGPTRPVNLVRELGISPQAIHRHLRQMVLAGQIESIGRGPKTHYHVAGSPQLDKAMQWCLSATEPTVNPRENVCETRDVFTGRLAHMGYFTRFGLKEDDLSLVLAVAGEIGNNCFDHNLGNWRDVPGCWFETKATLGRLWICIADRGQGVFRSLIGADPSILDDQTALVTAFEKTISGRFPENRGNGLKFVRNVIAGGEKRGLACRSGAGLVDYGMLGRNCRDEITRYSADPVGAITLFLWSLT